jgi:hypothetical protein
VLQHDPAGRLAFLHRTAEGKFFPYRSSFRRLHIFTVPLSPTRAGLLLGGLKKHMGYDAFQVRLTSAHARRSGLTLCMAGHCNSQNDAGRLKKVSFIHVCRYAGVDKTKTWLPAQIDFQTYRSCPVADERQFLIQCAIDVNSPKFPIPVQPAADFPDLMRVIAACDDEFEMLQRKYKGTIVLG